MILPETRESRLACRARNDVGIVADYYPEVPMLEEPQPRPGSSVNGWIKKPSPRVTQKSQEEARKEENEYDMDCEEQNSANNVSRNVDSRSF